MGVRHVTRVVDAQPTTEGAGVRLRRSIGTRQLDHLDPFLLLDEFKSDQAGDYSAGFPDHPHRGFETVTYMLAGAMRHEDHSGNRGNLVAGSIQWMTAGRGIIHSEMPQQQDGLMWGFQLWVNLPAREKMRPPRYQDIPPEHVPEVDAGPGTRVRVLAGSFAGVVGPVTDVVTRPTYLDVQMAVQARFEQEIPPSQTSFVYVYGGEVAIEGKAVHVGQLAVLEGGDRVAAAAHVGPARFLLLAAEPLREPVARYGPFVMNTRDEILQAVQDFQSGKLLG
jgi:redox-sensitive bicupin YhaK (pirin superfamily)